MLHYWKQRSQATKFSILAFILVFVLGLVSMGLLGFVLYYPVSFLFTNYPDINTWTGDWIWPATIGAGMAWAFGFLIAALAWHFAHKKTNALHLLRTLYITILWLWDAAIWYAIITSKVAPF